MPKMWGWGLGQGKGGGDNRIICRKKVKISFNYTKSGLGGLTLKFFRGGGGGN